MTKDKKRGSSKRFGERNLSSDRTAWWIYVVVGIFALLSSLPMLMVLMGSFRPNIDIVKNPVGLPTSFYFGNYQEAWVGASLGTYFLNSVVVTAGALALAFVLYVPAAYALGRWRFRGAAAIQALFLLGLMVALRIGIIPLTQMFDKWGLIDNLFGLILIYAASAAPMTVLIVSTFFRQLPDSLEEAALLDGASHPKIFWSVMLPLVKPALVTALVLDIGPMWNDFFMPLVMLRTTSKYTIPVGISSFFGEYNTDRGLLYAGIIIAVLPVIIFFSIAMKQVVKGLTQGIGK